MRPIDADALTEFLKCLLPERGMWEIEGDTVKNAVCETVAEAIEMVKNMETIQPEKAQHFSEGTTKDTISRQAAIEVIDKALSRTFAEPCGEMILKDAPSAQPEPKEGHWIPHESPDGSEQYECSECGVLWEFNDGTPEDNEAYYCPKCGARMKGERQK